MGTSYLTIQNYTVELHYEELLSDIFPDSFNPFITILPKHILGEVTIRRDLTAEAVKAINTSCPVIEKSSNLYGEICLSTCQTGWVFRLSSGCLMLCSWDFAKSEIYLCDSNHLCRKYPYEFPVLSSFYGCSVSTLLHVLWCQIVICRNIGFFCHASSVELNGRGFAFLGPSGYGKSTQSYLWTVSLGAYLINDDSPLVIPGKEEVLIAGTPWSGKTSCYRNVGRVLDGIFRLVRSYRDMVTEINQVDAFTAVLPSCSSIRSDSTIQERLYNLVVKTVSLSHVFRYHCTPRPSSPIEAYNQVSRIIQICG